MPVCLSHDLLLSDLGLVVACNVCPATALYAVIVNIHCYYRVSELLVERYILYYKFLRLHGSIAIFYKYDRDVENWKCIATTFDTKKSSLSWLIDVLIPRLTTPNKVFDAWRSKYIVLRNLHSSCGAQWLYYVQYNSKHCLCIYNGFFLSLPNHFGFSSSHLFCLLFGLGEGTTSGAAEESCCPAATTTVTIATILFPPKYCSFVFRDHWPWFSNPPIVRRSS